MTTWNWRISEAEVNLNNKTGRITISIENQDDPQDPIVHTYRVSSTDDNVMPDVYYGSIDFIATGDIVNLILSVTQSSFKEDLPPTFTANDVASVDYYSEMETELLNDQEWQLIFPDSNEEDATYVCEFSVEYKVPDGSTYKFDPQMQVRPPQST